MFETLLNFRKNHRGYKQDWKERQKRFKKYVRLKAQKKFQQRIDRDGYHAQNRKADYDSPQLIFRLNFCFEVDKFLFKEPAEEKC